MNQTMQKKFKQAVQEIRKLTVEDAGVFTKKMQALCTGVGVALVFVPEMKKVPWYGATKWHLFNDLKGKFEWA